MRAAGSDDKVALAPPVVFSLEDALEYIKADEYVEVTPKSMRLRKILPQRARPQAPTKHNQSNHFTNTTNYEKSHYSSSPC